MAEPVIVLSGAPGSGKTTTARRLAQSYPRAVHLHTDDFWHAIVSGHIAPNLPESNAQNHTVVKAVATAATVYALGDFTVVVDGVVGPWMLPHHYDAMRQIPTLEVHYIVLRASIDTTLRRARQRTERDGLVDDAPVMSMWTQFADLGMYERHALDTNEQTAAETSREVSEAVASRRYLLRI